MFSEPAHIVLVELYNQLMQTPYRENESFDHQSDAKKSFIAVMELWQNVHMDGFILYFQNCAEAARYAFEALQSIGAQHSFQLLSKATVIIFPLGFPQQLER